MGMANCGVSCIIRMNVYNEVSSILELQEVIPPYALGATACALREYENGNMNSTFKSQ